MNSSEQTLMNSSEQTLMNSFINVDCWTIVYSYLRFRDKIALRGVCTAARKHNHIRSIPNYISCNDQTIFEIPALAKLEYLSTITHYDITDKGIAMLPNLKSLNISGNNSITDDSIKGLTKLQDLCYNIWQGLFDPLPQVTGASIEKLTLLQTLEIINLQSITDDNISKLTNLRN